MLDFHWDHEEWEREQREHEDDLDRRDVEWRLLDRLNDYVPRREMVCVWWWRS